MTELRKLETGLAIRTIKGGFWVFSLRILDRLFQFVRIIVLARLLSPDDFGLFGIALLTLSALETFSQTGFKQALIQKKENTKPYLDTSWTLGIIRGFFVAAILFFIAPYAAIFFKAPLAESIIKVIGLAIILQSLSNIAVIYFEKELEFHKYFAYQFAGTIADIIVSISAALILNSVWALVFGLLARNLVRFILSYIIGQYHPHLHWDLKQIQELYSFGKWILSSSILVFLVTQGDDIFVGKLLGIAALGFYQMAYRISNMPATEITHVISQVTFPAYSKLQDNITKLSEVYLKILQLTAFLSFPITGLIFILAVDFTEILLGEKWMPIVPAMQVLALAGLTRSIAATTGPIFQGIGKPEIETKWQVFRLFILLSLIYPFIIQWGILGASFAVFLSNLVSTIGFCFMAIKLTKCGAKNFAKMIILPSIYSIIMILSLSALRISFNVAGILSFSLLLGLGVLTYFCAAYFLDSLLNYRIRLLLKWCLSLFREN